MVYSGEGMIGGEGVLPWMGSGMSATHGKEIMAAE